MGSNKNNKGYVPKSYIPGPTPGYSADPRTNFNYQDGIIYNNKNKSKNNEINKSREINKNRGINKNNRPSDKQVNSTGNFAMTASLLDGNGFFYKGIINKKKMLNFIIKVDYENPKYFKIKSVVATIESKTKDKHGKVIKNLSTDNHVKNQIDIEYDEFGGSVEVVVVIIYKISFTKSQEKKVTLFKKFC